MNYYNNFFSYPIMPFFPPYLQEPPTVYSILNSIVNYNKDEKTKIRDLAVEGRSTIFNFEYPLNDNINKEDFEVLILRKFLMRRINFETVEAFRIALMTKLNEIMPKYNKMFESFIDWDIFNDGEKITKEGNNDTITNSNSESNLENSSNSNVSNTNDKRYSNTPQDNLQDVRDGNYVSEYTYEQNSSNSEDNSNSSGTTKNNTDNKNTYKETIEHSPSDKLKLYLEYQNNIQSIYTLIFKDLEPLFYGLV